MAKIEKLLYRTTPVLPAVYDNALSYYEVLAKVVQKLNETIETVNNIDTQTIIDFIESGGADEALQERIDELAADLGEQVEANTAALKDTLLKYDHFYKATDLDGVKNDGTGNAYLGLRALMDELWTRGESAIVYLPSGVYRMETGTLPIPSNVILFGDGNTSILNRVNVPSPETDTGVLCPAGDNIVIYNLRLQMNIDGTPIQPGGLACGIGITNMQYPGIYPTFDVVRVPLRRNIVCDHIFSDSTYPLQAEIEKGTGRLEDIVFKNCNFDNGIVSMYPWYGAAGETSPGALGSRIENIKCKWLRVGGRNSYAANMCMYGAGLRVTNCRAEMAWLMSDGLLVNGLFIDARNGILFDNGQIDYGAYICGKVTIDGAFFLGGGSGRTYAIKNASLDSVMLSGVRVQDFASGYIAQPFASSATPGMAYLTNCDMGTPNCGVVGFGVNTLANVPSIYKYLDFTKARYATLVAGSGITFDVPNRSRVYAFGTMGCINCMLSGAVTWSPSVVLATVPAGFTPPEDNTLAIFTGTDQTGEPITKAVAIRSNGEIAPWGTDSSVTGWSGSLTALYSLV